MQELTLLPKALRKPLSGDDNLIPMINIVFLLLIFFMVAGQISPVDKNTLEPPLSGSEKPLEAQTLVLTLDRAHRLTLGDQSLALSELDAALQQATGGTKLNRVVVKADRLVKAGELDALLDVLRAHGITTITLYSQLAETQP